MFPMTWFPRAQIFMVGHYFLMALIVATYTGAFGPFLSSQGENTVKDFDSLAYDGKSVVVRGPMWDSEVPEAPFMGKHVGGNSETTTTRSTQVARDAGPFPRSNVFRVQLGLKT